MRTVLRLAFDERIENFNKEIYNIQNIEPLNYTERQVKLRETLKRKEILVLKKQHSPINCVVCGDRMEDLVYIPSNSSWRCVSCYHDWDSIS